MAPPTLVSLKRDKRAVRRIIDQLKQQFEDVLELEYNDYLIEAELKLEQVQGEVDRFRVLQQQALPLLAETETETLEQLEEQHSDESVQIEDILPQLRLLFRRHQNRYNAASSRRSILGAPAANMAPQQAKLPKIEIPKFSGDHRAFLDFKQLFDNIIVQNESLNSVQRLYYLKQALEGEPAPLIANFKLNESPFPEAWKTIVTRYENKRYIINAHLRDLFATQRIKSDKGIRKLLSDITKALKGIKIAGQDTAAWSTILLFMVYDRLDDETCRDFDRTITDTSTYPTYEAITKFLDNRAATVEFSEDRKQPPVEQRKPPSKSPKANRKSFATAQTSLPRVEGDSNASRYKGKCYACTQFHTLIDCPEFQKRNPTERYQIIKNNRLCLICFSSKHGTSQCSKRCRTCGSYHHHLLHRDNPNQPNVSSTPPNKQPAAPATHATTSGPPPDSIT